MTIAFIRFSFLIYFNFNPSKIKYFRHLTELLTVIAIFLCLQMYSDELSGTHYSTTLAEYILLEFLVLGKVISQNISITCCYHNS